MCLVLYYAVCIRRWRLTKRCYVLSFLVKMSNPIWKKPWTLCSFWKSTHVYDWKKIVIFWTTFNIELIKFKFRSITLQLGESGVPLYFHLPQMYIQIVLHSTNQTEQNKVKNAIHVCDFTGKKLEKRMVLNTYSLLFH